jgi:hypothetical protein
MLTYLEFNVTKQRHYEILDRFDGDDVSKQLEEAKRDGDSSIWSTVRLSSGISANILDFRIPQKHVVGDMLARRPAPKGWCGGPATSLVTRRKRRQFRERTLGRFI